MIYGLANQIFSYQNYIFIQRLSRFIFSQNAMLRALDKQNMHRTVYWRNSVIWGGSKKRQLNVRCDICRRSQTYVYTLVSVDFLPKFASESLLLLELLESVSSEWVNMDLRSSLRRISRTFCKSFGNFFDCFRMSMCVLLSSMANPCAFAASAALCAALYSSLYNSSRSIRSASRILFLLRRLRRTETHVYTSIKSN